MLLSACQGFIWLGTASDRHGAQNIGLVSEVIHRQNLLSPAPHSLTGWPRYQAGLDFSSLDRLKEALSSGSNMLLSTRPLDSG